MCSVMCFTKAKEYIKFVTIAVILVFDVSAANNNWLCVGVASGGSCYLKVLADSHYSVRGLHVSNFTLSMEFSFD